MGEITLDFNLDYTIWNLTEMRNMNDLSTKSI